MVLLKKVNKTVSSKFIRLLNNFFILNNELNLLVLLAFTAQAAISFEVGTLMDSSSKYVDHSVWKYNKRNHKCFNKRGLLKDVTGSFIKKDVIKSC